MKFITSMVLLIASMALYSAELPVSVLTFGDKSYTYEPSFKQYEGSLREYPCSFRCPGCGDLFEIGEGSGRLTLYPFSRFIKHLVAVGNNKKKWGKSSCAIDFPGYGVENYRHVEEITQYRNAIVAGFLYENVEEIRTYCDNPVSQEDNKKSHHHELHVIKTKKMKKNKNKGVFTRTRKHSEKENAILALLNNNFENNRQQAAENFVAMMIAIRRNSDSSEDVASGRVSR